MTLASSRGAFGATAIAAVQVISSFFGEEEDEDDAMIYVLSIRGREREREIFSASMCVSKSDDKYASRKMAFFG